MYESSELAGWQVQWLNADACLSDDPVSSPVLELQRNKVTDAFEGEQYAELDSDCQGPDNLDASGNPRGKTEELATVELSQNIPTQAGHRYLVSLRAMARPNVSSAQELEVGFAGVTVISDDQLPGAWTEYAVEVTVQVDNSRLEILDRGEADSLGVFIDDVSCDD